MNTLPPVSRSQYKRELFAWAFLPMMMGTVEGGVIGVLAKRFFVDSVQSTTLDWTVAALAAAQGFANISSFIWAGVSHGKHKIRFIATLKIVAVLLVCSIAVIPKTPMGLGMLLLCVVGSRVCLTGVITLRSTVWHANYPRSSRADVAGKIATIQAIILAGVSLVVGQLMDFNEESFRWIYPTGACFGIIGALVYTKMLVIGHESILESERANPQHATTAPWKTISLLFEDRPFAKYMACQFIFGVGNLMLTAPLIVILADRFSFDYLGEILIVTTIPIILMPFSIPLWSKLLRNMHVIQFRSIHSWVFVLSALCFGVSIVMNNTAGLWLAAAIRGIRVWGGVLAWNLGHQDFAPVEHSGRYMGLHVTLTGIRGLLAPALGMWLYTLVLSFGESTGATVFFIGAAISSVGGMGFLLLSRTYKHKPPL